MLRSWSPSTLALAAIFAFSPACMSDDSEDSTVLSGDSKADLAVGQNRLWKGGDVYVIPRTGLFTNSVLVALENTARELAANTGIRLHLIDDPSQAPDGNYVVLDGKFGYITKSFAPVGVSAGGHAEVSTFLTRHEVGHIVGLRHTMARKDRDEHIVVHAPFIKNKDKRQYRIASGSLIGPYDTGSVMHYPSFLNPFKGNCAAVSIVPMEGYADPNECVRRPGFDDSSEDDFWGEEEDSNDYRVIPEHYYFSQWNLSTMAALYCDARYCGDQCAPVERCATPRVQANLERLYQWEQSDEGQYISWLNEQD